MPQLKQDLKRLMDQSSKKNESIYSSIDGKQRSMI
jgi:hypothetical protein